MFVCARAPTGPNTDVEPIKTSIDYEHRWPVDIRGATSNLLWPDRLGRFGCGAFDEPAHALYGVVD